MRQRVFVKLREQEIKKRRKKYECWQMIENTGCKGRKKLMHPYLCA